MSTLLRPLLVALSLCVLVTLDASAQKPSPDKPKEVPAPAMAQVNRLVEEFGFEKSATQPGPTIASAAASTATTGEDESKRFHEYRMQQQKDKVTFAILLGVVALLAHLIVLGFLYRRAPEHIVGATGLVYIVFGTILLVVIANTEAQLTAAIGVLGAIAGYLFGRLRREDEPETKKPPTRAAGAAAGGKGP